MWCRGALALALAAAAALCVATAADEAAERVAGPVIGIDLGTTYSCVGIYKNGQVEIIPNDQGNRITPSVVAFTEDERLVGEAAKNQAAMNPSQTFFDVKRLIGKPFSDSALKKVVGSLPFRVVAKGDKPSLIASVKDEERQFEPEQISALVLGKMKQIAEQYLGAEVKHAVVTVPASFNNAQRQATKDAGHIAGLNVLRVLNEPTAAAVAYGLEQEGPRIVLVYDLGGGTFDVTILKIQKGVFEVLATSGDTHLGGEDFDQNVVQYFVKTFEKKHEKSGVAADPAALQKLRREAEKVKRMLSSTPQARFAIEALYDGAKFTGTLTRARFEEMNLDLFKRTISLMQKALQDAGLQKSNVDDVVLVGGSTRIPKVQQLVREFFDGKEPTRGINPDEAVAYGASLQAGTLSASSDSFSSGTTLLDVSPLTLGIETVGGVMTPVISRNSALPAHNSTIFTTHRDNQPALDIQVFEGERLLTKNNHRLGKFRLRGIGPAPRGQSQVEVTFDIDVNGILTVSAEDKSTGRNESLVVSNENGRLSPEQIEAMIQEAEEFAEEDKQAKDRADARTALDSFLLSVRAFIDGQAGPSDEERQRLQTAMLDGKDWLASHVNAAPEEIREKHGELEALCGEVTAQYGYGAHAAEGPLPGTDAVDDDMEGHDEL